MTIEELLLHKHTRMVADRLSKGEHPKSIAVSLAGDIVTEHLAKVLKVSKPDGKVVEVKVEKKSEPEIIDAEFREVK